MSAALAHSPGVRPSPPREYRIGVVADREGLAALRSEWAELLQRVRQPNVFLSWEWMTTWLQWIGKGGTPYILLARRAQDGALTGLAPLYRPPSRPLGLRSLTFMGTGVGADHFAFLCRQDVEAETQAALADYVLSQSGWQVLDFARLQEEMATWLVGKVSEPGREGVACSSRLADLCPYVPLPGTWEEYLRALGAKIRTDLARRRRRLEEQGQVTFQCAQTVGDLEATWEIFVRLHRARKDAVGDRSTFVSTDALAFHQEFARRAAERGWLRLHLMRVRDEYVAAVYCLSFERRVVHFQTGFDMDWARYGVGTLLNAHVIKSAIEEGGVELDFLRGAEPYKQQRWAALLRRDASLAVWRRHPGVVARIAVRRYATALKDHLRHLLAASTGKDHA